MRRPGSLLQEAWERRKGGAFPAGALTFPIHAWTRRRVGPAERAEAAAIASRFGFDELLVVHGSAFLAGTGVTLVSGPPGIGKSTVLRGLERRGLGRIVDDGILLVGTRGGRWSLVETGTLDVLARSSRIGSTLRSLIGVRYCFWQDPDPELLRRAHPVRSAVLSRLPHAAFTLSVAFGRRSGREHAPREHEVSGLVVLPHDGDPSPALRLRGGEEPIVVDLASIAPEGLPVVSVSPLGRLPEVRDRLREALLSALGKASGGPAVT